MKKTLRVIDWRNKQTKAIQEVGSQIGENASRIQETGSQISKTWKESQETSLQNELETKMAREEPRVVIDTHTANTLQSMGFQSNPNSNLKIKNLANREYVMNDVDITLEQNAFSFVDNLYNISLDFIIFLPIQL